MEVQAVTKVTDELTSAFNRLIPQLSSSPPPDRKNLQQLVNQPGTHLLVARNGDGTIVGTTTLVTYEIPTKTGARIEDVVVDQEARGQGAGSALTKRAIELAREEGAKKVDLTSRPKRKAANHMYQKMGFEERDTNVYRYRIDK